jgi:potassium channel subfamily K
MLGLVISSIYKFMKQLGEENIIQKHVERMRARTIERTVTSSFDLRRRESEHHLSRRSLRNKKISGPMEGRSYQTPMGGQLHRVSSMNALRPFARHRKPRLILMREEKDRFEAMRKIQRSTGKFKKWYALTVSVIAFGILWCAGAVVFWRCERGPQGKYTSRDRSDEYIC